ncbi:MAG TPA: hypothetical protein PLM90_14260, partial [Chitinophagales bacterium]|nr:hypothetical protein [Chitinophagales bacterium]
ANILSAGYDKAGNGTTDMNHILTDKGSLVVDKGDVNMTAAAANDNNVAGVAELPSIKDKTLSDHSVVAAINEPVALNSSSTGVTEGTTRTDAGVRVIKYYSADAQNASVQTDRPQPVVSDRGPRGDYGTSVNKPTTTGNNTVTNGVKNNTTSRPEYQQTPSREPVYNNNQTQRPDQPSYDRPSQTKPSYEQPKQPKQPTYEQPRNNTPSRSNDAPSKPSKSYDTPKSNSGSSSSRPSYNSGSSSRPSNSGSSGSKPGGSSPNKRSGGN